MGLGMKDDFGGIARTKVSSHLGSWLDYTLTWVWRDVHVKLQA